MSMQKNSDIAIATLTNTVRMQNGSLAVFSPVALTNEVRSAVKELGEVKYIVAPDQEHHIFLDEWHKEYPNTKLIAPDTLQPKREKSGQSLPWSVLFKANEPTTVDPDFDRKFDYEYVHSHQNKELVFNHKPSRTLIEADMLFNLPANEQMSKTGMSPTSGILTKLMMPIGKISGEAIWQRRFLWYGAAAADRTAFNKSVSKISGWDFDRIIPCHGDVIETGGKGVWNNVMAWHLEAQKKAN